MPSYTTNTNTWRNIKVNGTEKLGPGTGTEALDFKNGTNTTVTYDSGIKINLNNNVILGSPNNEGTLTLFSGDTLGASTGVLHQGLTSINVDHYLPVLGGDLFGSGNLIAGGGIKLKESTGLYTISAKDKIYLCETYTNLFDYINDDVFRNCRYFKIYYTDNNNCNHNCITINMDTNIFPTNSTTSSVNGQVFTLSCVGDVNKTYLRTATFHFVTKNGGGIWKLVFDSSFLWNPSNATGSSITWTSTKQTNYSNSYIKIIKLEYFFEDP